MNRILTFIFCAFSALILSSCGNGGDSNSARTSQSDNPGSQTAIQNPVAKKTPKAGKKDRGQSEAIIMSFFSDSNRDKSPYRLCEQKLTSQKAVLSAFPDSTEDFFEETTPEKDAFYYPKTDIWNNTLTRTVQIRYNYAALFNRVLHSYEWFERMSLVPSMDDDDDDEGEEEDEEPVTTQQDTLNWIRTARPKVSSPVLYMAFPDAESRRLAEMLLKAYDNFDGDDSTNSPFSRAMARYADALSGLPELVSEEGKDSFEEGFWDWYDKEIVFPGIDEIIKLHLNDAEDREFTDEQIENMRCAVEAEKNIDRRTILALEYVKFDRWNGTILLGEILESRIYTKYLLEAWISWRANVQMNQSPSSFSVIANNYYDQLRAICLDTMVRHCLQDWDKNTLCLIENMIFCEIIHRMGSLLGNSSLAILANLEYSEFIHPRLLENE